MNSDNNQLLKRTQSGVYFFLNRGRINDGNTRTRQSWLFVAVKGESAAILLFKICVHCFFMLAVLSFME